MAISITWGTKVINVPQSDLTPLGGGIYELDLDQFRLDLKALEDDLEGIPFPDTHRHNTEVVLSGVTYARIFEIINGYTVTFQDGQYAIEAKGANSNLADVMNVNQVSLRSFNSAGLITVVSGSGVTPQDMLDIADEVWDHSDATALGASIARSLGLAQENYYLDQAVYNGDGNLTSGRMRTYTAPGSVGTANDVLATYTITAVWSGTDLQTYSVVKQ